MKQLKQKLPRAPVRHDPLAIRTIVISGLPLSLDSKVLWKKIRKYEGAEKVDFPIRSDATSTGMFACIMVIRNGQVMLRSTRLVFYSCAGSSGREQVTRTCV